MVTAALPKMKPLTSWSFSRYSDYKKCPYFFKLKHLMGMKEPGSPAMQRGTDIHTLAENYTTGALKGPMPEELQLFSEEFVSLKKQKVKFVEESWTWTKDFQGETEWNDWSNAWLRVKLDVAYKNTQYNALVIIDHKTGKFDTYKLESYTEQLELYGLAGLLKFPDVDVVSPRLWYLDAGRIYPNADDEPELEFTRSDEKDLTALWLKRIEPMFKDTTCNPVPNSGCKWCHFRASNKGPCKY